jgi:hypothetical protein
LNSLRRGVAGNFAAKKASPREDFLVKRWGQNA